MNKDVHLQSLNKALPEESHDILLQVVMCRLRKTSPTLTSSFFESFSPGDSGDPSFGKILNTSLKPPQIVFAGKEIYCRFLLCPVAEALGWCESEGNVVLLTDYTNFTIEGINHLYGSPAKRPRKVPSLSLRAAQHKIYGKVERMYFRLMKGHVTFNEKSALLLACLDAPDDSLPPATRLVASAFDIKENCGSVNAMRHVPKEHQKTIRSGLVDSSVNGLHKFASIDRRDKKEYALLVVRQLRARKVDLKMSGERQRSHFLGGQERL